MKPPRMFVREIERLRTEVERLRATLDRLADYGLHTTSVGDGDCASLWTRIDEFRSGERRRLSAADVRELAEWWAELHSSLCALDEKWSDAQAKADKLLTDPSGPG